MYKNIALYKNIPFILFVIATSLLIYSETHSAEGWSWKGVIELSYLVYPPVLLSLVLHILTIKLKNKIFKITFFILNIILGIYAGWMFLLCIAAVYAFSHWS